MLFHSFSTQAERREYGGSDFIEFQYCHREQGTRIRKIVSAEHMWHWKNDSLYLHGDNADLFLFFYSDIFARGIYSDGKNGSLDLCGINYCSPESEKRIIKHLRERNSEDDRSLLAWLTTADAHNGFYILGV